MRPAGLAELLSVRTLKSLNLSECLHISGTEMIKGLNCCGAARAQLESLNLRSCLYVRVSHLWVTVCRGRKKGDLLLHLSRISLCFLSLGTSGRLSASWT